MTNEIYDKAGKIKQKLFETERELKIFKNVIYRNGCVKLFPELYAHGASCISHFVSDYLKRENVATEIIEIMEAEIQKLQKEYAEL